mgnify:CR=1 FL=1
MPYIGISPVTGDSTSSFKVLDSISSFTQTFDGSSSSVVSLTNNTISITSHRFITGQRVTYATTGTTIGGLTSGSVYYIIKQDQNSIKLASSLANANNNTEVALTSLGVGSTHTINVAFDGVNTKFKATYDNGTKALFTRAAQLMISVNGVIQQPFDTTAPVNGFGFDLDGVIIFSTPPVSTDTFWGTFLSSSFASFDISDNTVDTFTGTGAALSFTLSKKPANSQNVLVTVNGVVQYPSDNTTIRSYSVNENVITFTVAPGNGTSIQVRHIGFAGATSSSVTGFYGRSGNVGLTTGDSVSIGSATIGVGAATTSLLVQGNARITGILSIGQGTVTIDGNTNTVTASSITVTNLTAPGGVGYATTGYVTSSLVGYATQGYVTQQITNLVNGAPGALDTLNELSAALNNDANFATTVTNSIASKLSNVGIRTAGGTVGTGATILDFRGAGISTVTVAAGIATINITGGGSGTGGAIMTSTAPPSPTDGQLWFDLDTGVSYIYYQSQSTWVSQQMFEY